MELIQDSISLLLVWRSYGALGGYISFDFYWHKEALGFD